MNSGLDFAQWIHPLPDHSILSDLKILAFSDGGLRKEVGKAAVGWVIVAVANGACWMLGKGGACVDCGAAGSFLIEAIAFETLIDNITTLCTNTAVCDNTWQHISLIFSTESERTITRS